MTLIDKIYRRKIQRDSREVYVLGNMAVWLEITDRQMCDINNLHMHTYGCKTG